MYVILSKDLSVQGPGHLNTPPSKTDALFVPSGFFGRGPKKRCLWVGLRETNCSSLLCLQLSHLTSFQRTDHNSWCKEKIAFYNIHKQNTLFPEIYKKLVLLPGLLRVCVCVHTRSLVAIDFFRSNPLRFSLTLGRISMAVNAKLFRQEGKRSWDQLTPPWLFTYDKLLNCSTWNEPVSSNYIFLFFLKLGFLTHGALCSSQAWQPLPGSHLLLSNGLLHGGDHWQVSSIGF